MTTDAESGPDGSSRLLRVWVDGWQIQCCGDPFEVGSLVEWTLDEDPDRDWLSVVLGHDVARQITHGEEHHGGLPEDAPVTVGRVTRVRAVSCRFGPVPNSVSAAAPVQFPISGTAVVVDVPGADGWYAETDDLHFSGYVVDLEKAGP